MPKITMVKRIHISIAVACFIAIGTIGLVVFKNFLFNPSPTARIHENKANGYGASLAKHHCNNLSDGSAACETLKTSASSSECKRESCWLVYANTDDNSLYGAAMRISYEDEDNPTIESYSYFYKDEGNYKELTYAELQALKNAVKAHD